MIQSSLGGPMSEEMWSLFGSPYVLIILWPLIFMCGVTAAGKMLIKIACTLHA